MKNRALPFILLAVVALAALLRRIAVDQYWLRRNRIWDDGWASAWDCAADHMRVYEDIPERYIAEHGFWWRDNEQAQP